MASSFHMYGIENKIYKTKHKQQDTKYSMKISMAIKLLENRLSSKS